ELFSIIPHPLDIYCSSIVDFSFSILILMLDELIFSWMLLCFYFQLYILLSNVLFITISFVKNRHHINEDKHKTTSRKSLTTNYHIGECGGREEIILTMEGILLET